MTVVYKKRIHLKNFDYTGFYIYFVTLCVRRNVGQTFQVCNPVNHFVQTLKELSNNYDFRVWAYCFMPDHLHLLLEGKTENSNLRKFIRLRRRHQTPSGDECEEISAAADVAKTDGTADSCRRGSISMYKQKTGFYYKKNFGVNLWQINYYEHILRKKESVEKVAGYIFNNPVRKGLSDDFSSYPFSGSFLFDFRGMQPWKGLPYE